MKKEQIQVGRVYAKRVGARIVPVRITLDLGYPPPSRYKPHNRHLGWDGTNLKTGRKVHVKSASALRFEMTADGKGPAMPVRGREAAAKAIADAPVGEPVMVDLTEPDPTFPGYSKDRVEKGLDRLADDVAAGDPGGFAPGDDEDPADGQFEPDDRTPAETADMLDDDYRDTPDGDDGPPATTNSSRL